MNAKNLLNRLQEKISAASKTMDLDELLRWTNLARRVQEIEHQQVLLDQELKNIDASCLTTKTAVFNLQTATSQHPNFRPPSISQSHSKGDMEIEIVWASLKIDRPTTIISERKVSNTLVQFVAELGAVLGESLLSKLTEFVVNRGPFVSKEPMRDYVNNVDGSIYTHHPVPGFENRYWVLTHSSTDQKIRDIRDAVKFLGFPPTAIRISRSPR